MLQIVAAQQIISPPGNDSFREDLCFAGIYFIFFFPCIIFELRGPIGAKFSTMLGNVFDFIILIQNFEGASPKKFRGKKRAKFGPILIDFKL